MTIIEQHMMAKIGRQFKPIFWMWICFDLISRLSQNREQWDIKDTTRLFTFNFWTPSNRNQINTVSVTRAIWQVVSQVCAIHARNEYGKRVYVKRNWRKWDWSQIANLMASPFLRKRTLSQTTSSSLKLGQPCLIDSFLNSEKVLPIGARKSGLPLTLSKKVMGSSLSPCSDRKVVFSQ